jgi:hypothetical protein
MAWMALAPSLLLPIGLVCGNVHAQRLPPNKEGPKFPPPLPGDTVDLLLPLADRDAVRTAVEAMLQRKLINPPAVGVVEPKAMRLAVERAIRAVQKEGPVDATQLDQLALRTVALYDPQTKSIFIGSGGLAAVPESDRGDAVRILFAHAVAHAIIDQELGLADYAAGDSAEVAIARRMLTEGFTVVARDRVVQSMGINPFAPNFRNIVPGMVDPKSGSSLERSIYVTGRIVAESVWNAAGVDAMWSFMKTRPSTVRELATKIPRSKAIRLVGAAVEPRLPAKDWVRVRAPAAPSLSVATMEGLTPEERRELATFCLASETLGYSGPQGEAVLFSAMRMKDDAQAELLARTFDRMPGAMRTKLGERGVQVELKETEREIGGVTFRIASLRAPDGEGRPTTIVRARVAREAVAVTISNATLPAETLTKALEALAASLGADPEFVSDEVASGSVSGVGS